MVREIQVTVVQEESVLSSASRGLALRTGKGQLRQRFTYLRLLTDLARYGVQRLKVSCHAGQGPHGDVFGMSGK